jgi:hypothetical protein
MALDPRKIPWRLRKKRWVHDAVERVYRLLGRRVASLLKNRATDARERRGFADD